MLGLTCCGRFTLNGERLYHQQEGYPPFSVHGPALPARYQRGDRFSIWHRAELWSEDDLTQVIPHTQKVWALTLVGDVFGDRVLTGLPEFPSMEILELKHGPIHGSALAAPSSQPKLRVMRVDLAQPDLLRFERVPVFPVLDMLTIRNLPSSPCGLEELLGSVPHVRSLTLESSGIIFLDAPISGASRDLEITARNPQGDPRLPREVGRLSLHLRESTVADLARLLRSIEKVRALFLNGTPVDDQFAEELVARFAPEFISLVGTKVSADGLRRLHQNHPELRMAPGSGSISKSRDEARSDNC